MTASRPQHADTTSGAPPVPAFEAVVLALGGALAVCGFATWVGAQVAAAIVGGRVRGGLVDSWRVALRLARRPGDPAAAWGELASGLPGPALYWACTAVTWLAVASVAVVVVRLWRAVAGSGRARFGESVDARVARRRDVAPLVVSTAIPPTGRLLLGRMARRGPLLATEDR